MESDGAPQESAGVSNDRTLAVSIVDIAFEVRRKSHEVTGVLPLTSGVLDVIRVIERHPGINVAEVAARLGRQLSNTSSQLRELVELGLVTRIRSESDKRFVALYPAPEAIRIKAVLEGAWEGAVRKAGVKLSPSEREQLAAALPALQRLASILAEPD